MDINKKEAVSSLNRNYLAGSKACYERNELTFQAMATLLFAGGA